MHVHIRGSHRSKLSCHTQFPLEEVRTSILSPIGGLCDPGTLCIFGSEVWGVLGPKLLHKNGQNRPLVFDLDFEDLIVGKFRGIFDIS